MRFERVYDFAGDALRIRTIIDLGFQEHMGEIRADKRFRETTLAGVRRQPVTPFGPGLALVLPCTFELLEEEDGEVIADVEVGVGHGRLACVGILARPGRELTGAFLRCIPIAGLVGEAARANTVRVLRTPRGAVFGGRFVADDPDRPSPFGDLARELNADLKRTADHRVRRTITPEFLDAVAAVYLDAIAHHQPPAKAVQERFGPTTPENARRWIMHARNEGRLGPAPGPGRAGETRATNSR